MIVNILIVRLNVQKNPNFFVNLFHTFIQHHLILVPSFCCSIFAPLNHCLQWKYSVLCSNLSTFPEFNLTWMVLLANLSCSRVWNEGLRVWAMFGCTAGVCKDSPTCESLLTIPEICSSQQVKSTVDRCLICKLFLLWFSPSCLLLFPLLLLLLPYF